MSEKSVLQAGVEHLRAARFSEAEPLLRQALARRPGDAESMFYLGVCRFMQDDPAEAERLLTSARDLAPTAPQPPYYLGLVCQRQQRWAEAAAHWQRGVGLDPTNMKQFNELGNALRRLGRFAEAAEAYRRAAELTPDHPGPLVNLSQALLRTGDPSGAVAAAQKAAALSPADPATHMALAEALSYDEQPSEAVSAYRRAIELKPTADMYNNMAVMLHRVRRYGESVDAAREALRLAPDHAESVYNLANALSEQGRMGEALPLFRRALEQRPDNYRWHCALIFNLQHDPQVGAGEVFAELRRFAERHAAPFAAAHRPHTPDRRPNRPLRIGYVSPDLRDHAVAYYLEPVLANHDRRAFHVICYDDGAKRDDVNRRLRGHAAEWREIDRMEDDQLDQLIRADRVDILIDLASHTAKNRLLMFARRPAPIQMTWLAYASSTGLDAIDYRITDGFVDPPGLTDPHHSEKLLRLPNTHWVFRPSASTPPITVLPAIRNRRITFLSANRLCKISPWLVGLWAKVLAATPGSTMQMLAPGLGEPQTQDYVLGLFAAAGVDRKRVRLREALPIGQFLSAVQDCDIALDTFPYNGGTVSTHCLWMGVPVVTLAGDRPVSRVGSSLLHNVGLRDLVAYSPEQFVRIATELAADTRRLADIRGSLRERMLASPLTDAAGFTRDIESAFRQAWQEWLRSSGG